MSKGNSPYIFVVGNEKGGAGKTTCSMHLIVALLYQGYKVATIDIDSRQASLTNYLKNRELYNKQNPDKQVVSPQHFHLPESLKENKGDEEEEQKIIFEKALTEASNADYIIIDTPGSHTFLSRLAHSYADTIITPINDSFLDLDVIAKINAKDGIISPSIYSQMIWEQKMQRASRDKGSIEWIILRNRLSNLDAVNKRRVANVLNDLAKRISFKLADGFSERVIFRELFLQGLTLLDLKNARYDRVFSTSHVLARQELRNFLSFLGIKPVF
ncbi:division plane positioning ATPase MipZ [Rickettsia endosymbiont of Halotydeus destructor]|uniref:division plane positioning ATPase MipZ n=1 Tax=Rickettsia endosymbiont of Halotydeus destructor TaxID=2996754 RepID=UPI003BB101B6